MANQSDGVNVSHQLEQSSSLSPNKCVATPHRRNCHLRSGFFLPWWALRQSRRKTPPLVLCVPTSLVNFVWPVAKNLKNEYLQSRIEKLCAGGKRHVGEALLTFFLSRLSHKTTLLKKTCPQILCQWESWHFRHRDQVCMKTGVSLFFGRIQ